MGGGGGGPKGHARATGKTGRVDGPKKGSAIYVPFLVTQPPQKSEGWKTRERDGVVWIWNGLFQGTVGLRSVT